MENDERLPAPRPASTYISRRSVLARPLAANETARSPRALLQRTCSSATTARIPRTPASSWTVGESQARRHRSLPAEHAALDHASQPVAESRRGAQQMTGPPIASCCRTMTATTAARHYGWTASLHHDPARRQFFALRHPVAHGNGRRGNPPPFLLGAPRKASAALALASLLPSGSRRRGSRRRTPRPAPFRAQGQDAVIYLHLVGRARRRWRPVRLQAEDEAEFYSTRTSPTSIRNGQRLTTMTSGQTRFPIAPSIFQFAQHGKSGACGSPNLLPYTAKHGGRHVPSSAACIPRPSTTSRPSPSSRAATDG